MENQQTPLSLSSVARTQENFILQALANVHKLIRYKLGAAHKDSIEDLRQRVFYKIWMWRHRHHKELELNEWQKIINVTVNTEVAEYFSEKGRHEILFSETRFENCEGVLSIRSFASALEGNSDAEVRSLMRVIWKGAHNLTLRQRYAFLLNNPDFLVEFVTYGCCSAKEIADFFEMTEAEIARVLKLLPLRDERIGLILQSKINRRVSPKVLWEARVKAKNKLTRVLKDYYSSGARGVITLFMGFVAASWLFSTFADFVLSP